MYPPPSPMNLTKIFWGAVLAACVLVLFLGPSEARAMHGPNAQTGNTPSLSAWCGTEIEVDLAVKLAGNEDPRLYIRFMNGSNSCMDVRLLGFPPRPVVVLEVIRTYDKGNGFVAEVIKAKTGSGSVVYSWHRLAMKGA